MDWGHSEQGSRAQTGCLVPVSVLRYALEPVATDPSLARPPGRKGTGGFAPECE